LEIAAGPHRWNECHPIKDMIFVCEDCVLYYGSEILVGEKVNRIIKKINLYLIAENKIFEAEHITAQRIFTQPREITSLSGKQVLNVDDGSKDCDRTLNIKDFYCRGGVYADNQLSRFSGLYTFFQMYVPDPKFTQNPQFITNPHIANIREQLKSLEEPLASGHALASSRY
jgi:hypothetical protein